MVGATNNTQSIALHHVGRFHNQLSSHPFEESVEAPVTNWMLIALVCNLVCESSTLGINQCRMRAFLRLAPSAFLLVFGMPACQYYYEATMAVHFDSQLGQFVVAIPFALVDTPELGVRVVPKFLEEKPLQSQNL